MSWLITGSEKTPVDPVFNNVSLLLHGNGTNGSTTITDSSPSPKTVTPVGNAQISTGGINRAAFGNSSIAFDGTGDYLDISSIAFATNESFTLECWLYKTQRDDSSYSVVFAAGGSNQIGYDINTEGSIFLYIDANFGVPESGTAVPTNSWCHLAWTRQGTTCRAFVNGILQGTGTRGNAFTISRIGALGPASNETHGYIDDLRITKGIARYTANFTPPTAPFPDI